MVDITGAPVPTNLSPFDVPADLKSLADHFGASETVAAAANLPGSGNWQGRKLTVRDTWRTYTWTGSAWVRETPWWAASGTVTCPASGGGGSAPVFWSDLIPVTFPAGLFAAPPRVIVQTIGPNGAVPMGGMVEQITKDGCQVRAFRVGSVPGAGFSAVWLASAI